MFTGYYVSDDWGMSFIVPGLLIAGCGLLVWLFMIAKPEDIGIELEATESPEASSDSDNPGIVSHNFLHVCLRVLPSLVAGIVTTLSYLKRSDCRLITIGFSRKDATLLVP